VNGKKTDIDLREPSPTGRQALIGSVFVATLIFTTKAQDTSFTKENNLRNRIKKTLCPLRKKICEAKIGLANPIKWVLYIGPGCAIKVILMITSEASQSSEFVTPGRSLHLAMAISESLLK